VAGGWSPVGVTLLVVTTATARAAATAWGGFA
jgi:hypothetical protein